MIRLGRMKHWKVWNHVIDMICMPEIMNRFISMTCYTCLQTVYDGRSSLTEAKKDRRRRLSNEGGNVRGFYGKRIIFFENCSCNVILTNFFLLFFEKNEILNTKKIKIIWQLKNLSNAKCYIQYMIPIISLLLPPPVCDATWPWWTIMKFDRSLTIISYVCDMIGYDTIGYLDMIGSFFILNAILFHVF